MYLRAWYRYSDGMKSLDKLESGEPDAGACRLCGTRMPVHTTETVRGRAYHLCSVCDLMQMAEKDRLGFVEEKSRYLQHNNSIRTPGYISFLERLIIPVTAKLDQKGRKADDTRGLDFGSGPYPMMAELMAERGFLLELYDPVFAPREKSELLATAYDYIICCETAEHFFKPFEEFQFMTNLLAPGGFIAVMTSLRRADSALASWHYAKDATHVALYSERTMYWIAERFGLRMSFPHDGVVFFEVPATWRSTVPA